jgi:NAD(P)-dependent dehydrogenase (short-subunit alcohol dehydrogenase family)
MRLAGKVAIVTGGSAGLGAAIAVRLGQEGAAVVIASKGAVMSLTRSLARELGKHNILVNAVSPGYTLTHTNLANEEYLAATRQAVRDLRCVPRDAYPDDIVGAVTFLASDDAKFITGQILAVDGGAVYH